MSLIPKFGESLDGEQERLKYISDFSQPRNSGLSLQTHQLVPYLNEYHKTIELVW